jgi:hypothetical protein
VPSLLRGLALQWRAQTLRKTPGTLLFCRTNTALQRSVSPGKVEGFSTLW